MTSSPAQLAAVAPTLVAAFKTHRFTLEGLMDLLGPAGMAAWRRGEPAAVRRLCRADEALPLLVRAFLLKDEVSFDSLAQLIGPEVAALILEDGSVAFDIIPHVVEGEDHWVFSDVDASMVQHVPGPDHVLGVGAASLSLLATVPLDPVDAVLDLGTGSGIQILGQLGVAKRVVGTDVHARALDFARATLAGNDHVELREGSWFEPVAGEKFDRIVANPPFVVGLPQIGHVYRDSGLSLDGASELVVSQLADHLKPGGTAHVLAAWVHTDADRWQSRVASWLPDTGVCAWIVQRDVVDPEMYVGTWLRDESIDPRSPEARERTEIWLDYFAEHGVTGIGFGYVAVQRLDDDVPSDILAEELSHDFSDPLRDEVSEYFLRCQWLREVTTPDILASQFLVRPSLASEKIAIPDQEQGMGFATELTRITRMDGPRWSHEVDEHLLRIVSGLHPAGLSLGEIIDLYAMANDVDVETFGPAAVGACIDLIRHGFIIPSELFQEN
ncbi:Ribosomal RNA small subunit methyltransferase C [Corynebacterium kalinowskii]|uniref:Ribosomal RNA small subunit methyltransferase C n=1 Tax=Corynebacterium kalinowskii TaxID=2675216 RepID=A0A6B8VAN2_9CORY|nr:class I SAM-dependent methyltransferase [Corynebacterium kalinowskii]QGU02192.1 Ribosomal RNA small subunit methyltransferase C [Corynebacterium kalinowskii]